MKKSLLVLVALLSISSISLSASKSDWNIYTKLGFDVHSKFTAIKDEGDEIVGKKGKLGVNFALEATKNMTPEFELGLGLAYTHRNSVDISYTYDERHWNYVNTAKFPRYSSVPLYLVTKYNFNTDSAIKPYIKANLGYSFNHSKDFTLHEVETDRNTGVVTEEDYKVKIKTKNGLYAEIGIGAEYNNFLAELSYVHTSAKLRSNAEDSEGEDILDKVNNQSIRLSVGYKFNF